MGARAYSVTAPPASGPGPGPGPAARAAGGLRALAGAARRWLAAGAARRRAASYSDLVAAAMLAAASGEASAAPAAVEAAGRLVGRAMLEARVEGAPALTPQVMAQIGRSLVLHGESLHALYVGPDGAEALLPAGSWDVEGGPHPDSWIYRAELYGPTGETAVRLAAGGVLHVVADPPPSRPWRGTTPARSDAARTAALAASAMAAEMRTATAKIIPMGNKTSDATSKSLAADVRAARGKVCFPPTLSAGLGEGRAGAPQGDWQPRRIGPDPAAAQVAAQADAEARLSAALGWHPSAASAQATAGAMREARRQLQVDLLDPWARLIEHAARRLWPAARIGYPARTDVVLLQARAAETLVRLGLTPDEALRLAELRR